MHETETLIVQPTREPSIAGSTRYEIEDYESKRRRERLDFEKSVLPIFERGRRPVRIEPWPKKPLKAAA